MRSEQRFHQLLRALTNARTAVTLSLRLGDAERLSHGNPVRLKRCREVARARAGYLLSTARSEVQALEALVAPTNAEGRTAAPAAGAA